MSSRRLIQRPSGGPVEFEGFTSLFPKPAEVVVATRASLISGGTELATRALAESSLLAKARDRPDLVRRVLSRARSEGIGNAVGVVRRRLSDPVPLGYSASGVVVRVGEGATDLRPGDRVATAGAGHADLQVVAGNLAVKLPASVTFEEGAFGALCAVALNGLRLARVGPGDRVLVVGMGLVGQIAGRLALASGAIVAGIDPVGLKRVVAKRAHISAFPANEAGWETATASTSGVGFDAVLITAATDSSDPVRRATGCVRDQGSVVVVGNVGLQLDRRPMYDNEVRLVVARSYGPGRYDPTYENLGIDYPIGQVRWTAGRNMAAAMELVAGGRLELSDLISHRFAFDDAQAAYDLLEAGGSDTLAIILTYSGVTDGSDTVIPSSVEKETGPLSLGAIGAGRYAREVLFPAALAAGFNPLRLVASARGTGATQARAEFGFGAVANDPDEVISDSGTAVLLVASDHASHAGYVVRGLEAGRHVFCEKPLAVTEQELEEVELAWSRTPGSLLVGHNRRWSRAVNLTRGFLSVGGGPLQIIYRVNTGQLPEGHWLTDRRQGGRLIGEVCHFIDTCNAITGTEPRSITALTSGNGELILDNDISVMIGYADGSQAVITYATSSAVAAGKERIEIMGRSRYVVVEDFGRIRMSGPSGSRVEKIKPADKGHRRQMAAFAEMVRGERDSRPETAAAFLTSRVVFAAVRSASEGRTVYLDSPGS